MPPYFHRRFAMRLPVYGLVITALIGCGSESEQPNPLEKANVSLPVITMPTGYFPPKPHNSALPLLDQKMSAGAEIALEGIIEVADPKMFQPDRLFVKFVVVMNDRKVIAGTHKGGTPIPDQGNQFRYRSAVKAPPRAGTFHLEVYQRKDLVASARVQIESSADKSSK